MNPNLPQEIALLEAHLLEDVSPSKRSSLKVLLHILDRIAQAQSRLYYAERHIGAKGDHPDMLHLASQMTHAYRRFMVRPVKTTDKRLFMELLKLRDATITKGWLCTPKGKFLVKE